MFSHDDPIKDIRPVKTSNLFIMSLIGSSWKNIKDLFYVSKKNPKHHETIKSVIM